MGPNKTNSIAVKIVVIAVIGLLFIGTVWLYRRNETKNVVSDASPEQAVNQNSSAPTTTYKNGTYTVIGSYTSPAGPEQIEISLTIEQDIITNAVAVVKATNPGSKMFQTDFANNFKTQVIGKSLSDLQLVKVSGSSLTPKGFNDALAKIKTQAQAQL